MIFDQPQWFLMIPIAVLAGWRWKKLRLFEPLRVLAIALLILLLVDLQIRQAPGGLDLWVLVDKSQSAGRELSESESEILDLLRDSKSSRDRLHIVDFAEVVQKRVDQSEVFPGKGLESRISLAGRAAISQMNPDRHSRLLIISDGFSTEPLHRLRDALMARGIQADLRLLRGSNSSDYQVAFTEVPTRVQPGQSFLIKAQVSGSGDEDLNFSVSRDGNEVYRGVAEVREGSAELRLVDRLPAAGSFTYIIEIEAPGDPIPENNHHLHWVEVTGSPQVLLVSAFNPDPVEAVLREMNMSVRVVREPEKLGLADLTGVKVVIINGVPAHKIGSKFMASLPFFVQGQGGGLVMAGGKQSFGAGGYFSSKIDPLLPVSMELRKEHLQLSVAMSIVLDRSGSMSAQVSSGGGAVTKMNLANEGAARTIELLGAMDSISVFAVDSEPHEIVPQTRVGKDPRRLINRVRRVQSRGGGIYVYTGLEAAWEQLKKAEQGQRHVILFSDAADSEEPGNYKSLLATMLEQRTTVSVIGLGEPTDSDAAFLEDIARRGGGRMFFNQNPSDLPALFAQETVAVARSAFIDDPVTTLGLPGWGQISGTSTRWMSQVDGYNLSYLRPEATAALISGDEYEAPLVAFWNRGRGRTAAVSFALAGPHSTASRQWKGYGNFIQTLVRWLQGEELPPGLALKTAMEGNSLRLDFIHGDEWTSKLASQPPEILIAREGASDDEELEWELMSPGHYVAHTPLKPGTWLRGSLGIEKLDIPFGPIINGRNSEWDLDRTRRQELQQLVYQSGGREILDLSELWDVEKDKYFSSIRNVLLIAFLHVLVADAFLTRIDVSLWNRMVGWFKGGFPVFPHWVSGRNVRK